MLAASELLRTSAQAIAAFAAELHDSDDIVSAVQRAVESAADCMRDGRLLDVSELSAHFDEAHLGRVLRTIMAEGIECLRRGLPEPEFPGAVLLLRGAIQRAIPHPAADPADREFYAKIMSAGCLESEAGISLFQDLSFTFNDILYVHDLNGTLLYLNQGAMKLTEFTRQDVLDTISIYDLVAPEYIDLIEARLESPGAVSRAPYTSVIYTKCGQRVPCEICSRCIVRGGHIVGIIGVARDLRLARRLESEIARLNACMDSLLRGLPSAVLFTDAKGIIQDANASAAVILGSPSPAALIGMTLSAACNEPRPVLHDVLMKILAEDREKRLRYSGISRFGARLDCDLTIAPVRTPEGGSSFVIIMCDLSGHQAIAEAKVKAEKLDSLEDIIGKIAHEINNPLTGILGYAQLLLNGQLEPAIRARVEHVAMEAERCRTLVQNLHKFSHHDVNVKTPQDLNCILNNVLSLREYQWYVDQISIHTELQPGLPPVLADADDLQRVCMSFLMNAEQALNTADSDKKSLTVRTYTRDDCVCLEFADNGPGIPKCIQSKIFDPFFSTKGVGGGSGLGLSVAYGMIRSHGGTISLESDEGRGATFTISLPAGAC